MCCRRMTGCWWCLSPHGGRCLQQLITARDESGRHAPVAEGDIVNFKSINWLHQQQRTYTLHYATKVYCLRFYACIYIGAVSTSVLDTSRLGLT